MKRAPGVTVKEGTPKKDRMPWHDYVEIAERGHRTKNELISLGVLLRLPLLAAAQGLIRISNCSAARVVEHGNSQQAPRTTYGSDRFRAILMEIVVGSLGSENYHIDVCSTSKEMNV